MSVIGEDFEWSAEQVNLIHKEKHVRQLVDAGPGMGKTAILAARVAHLIGDQEVSPSNITVMTFTKTAVVEMKSRLVNYLGGEENFRGLRVGTIDSNSWQLNIGFNLDASLASFAKNIKDVKELIKSKDSLFEYLGSVEHVFIDEAQDVVGMRCELILEYIHALPENCGVTIFSDDAQAIYTSWANDESQVEGTLSENIKTYFSGNFEFSRLEKTHRTTDSILLDLYQSARSVVLSGAKAEEKLKTVRKLVRSKNHGCARDSKNQVLRIDDDNIDDHLYLYRRRAEVLQQSYESRESPHRLRLTGLPPPLIPELAVLFWDWTKDSISYQDFFIRSEERLKDCSSVDPRQLWQDLLSVAAESDSEIDMRILRARLASMSPPRNFVMKDFGPKGPVYGTIHTSKGRESETVILHLPKISAFSKRGMEEESRVTFVGATRAKKNLYVRCLASEAEYGKYRSRVYRLTGTKLRWIHIEVGLSDDIFPQDLVGTEAYSYDQALESQDAIRKLIGEHTLANAEFIDVRDNKTNRHRWKVANPDGSGGHLCYLSSSFQYHMKGLPYEFSLRGHGRHIKGFSIFGVRTMLVSENNPLVDLLHDPYRRSGFMLAPNVAGFPLIEVKLSPTIML